MSESEELEIQINDAYIPAIDCQSRFLILKGGGGSGKSVFASWKIANRTVTEEGHKFLILRKVANTIKKSVFAEIKDRLSEMGCLHEFEINKTDKEFLHIPTGNQIFCLGLDEPEKVKSISGITGMWIEEATEFEEDDIDQLNIRVRGEKKNYIQFILTFNPISEDHFLKKKYFDKTPDNCTILETTHLDNFYLTTEDRKVLEDLKERNPLYYDIYCLGKWGVVDKSNKFMYSFNEEKQVVEGLKIIDRLPIWLTFDFNIDPMTCTVAQRPHVKKLQCLKSIQLDNSDIYQMLDRIKAEYPNKLFMATGDASGHNRIGAVRGKTSYWKIIVDYFGLRDHQTMVRKQNLGLIDSRVLCNAVNQANEIVFDKAGCQPLINDLKFAKVDDRGELIKDRKKQKNDFLDGFRYLTDANFHDFLSKPKKYA